MDHTIEISNINGSDDSNSNDNKSEINFSDPEDFDLPDQDAEIEKPTVVDDITNTATITVAIDTDVDVDVDADAIPSTSTTTDSNSKRITWNGKRPFEGAVMIYISDYLNPAIEKAKQNLEKNPKWTYSVVEIPLFATIQVDCTDQTGKSVTKRFAVHETHYGPLIRPSPSIPRTPYGKWFNFYNRSQMIWLLIKALNNQAVMDPVEVTRNVLRSEMHRLIC